MSDKKGFNVQADTDRVLMSDVLKGQVPSLDDDVAQQMQGKAVVVVAHRTTGNKRDAMVGVLRGILLGADPEVEFRSDLKEALAVLNAPDLRFTEFELHHGEEVAVKIPGPFVVKAARIDEIASNEQLCTLGLHLARQQR